MNANTLAACYAVQRALKTLAIDVGGSGLKAGVLDARAEMIGERVRIDTPVGAAPDAMVATLVELVRELPDYDRVAVGFPGMVRDGVVLTAPNLGNSAWARYPLAASLQEALRKPVRVANDADVQGLAVISGQGVEMVITLGTGFGTGLYENGRPCPHLELSQHPIRKDRTYDEHLGNAALQEAGPEKWQRRVLRAIETLRTLTHFDRLYIGGGNAKKLDCQLPEGVTVVDNSAGVRGGAFLFGDVQR